MVYCRNLGGFGRNGYARDVVLIKEDTVENRRKEAQARQITAKRILGLKEERSELKKGYNHVITYDNPTYMPF